MAFFHPFHTPQGAAKVMMPHATAPCVALFAADLLMLPVAADAAVAVQQPSTRSAPRLSPSLGSLGLGNYCSDGRPGWKFH